MAQRTAVQSYSGFKADERPSSFSLGNQILEITEVVDRWYDLDHNYFRVLAAGKSYLLRHNFEEDIWELMEPDPGDGSTEAGD